MDKTISMYISHIHHLFKKRIDINCEKLGFSGAYFKIFMAIGFKGYCNQNEIGQISHLSAPTISLTLRKMEIDGIIKRENDKIDQRIVNVSFTEEGQKLREQIKKVFEEEDKKLSLLLDEEEFKTTINALEKIENYLEDK